MKTKANIEVVKDPANPVPFKVMEQAIVDVASFAKQINASRLANRTVDLLIRDATGINLGDIRAVLNAAAALDKHYLKS